VKLRTHSPSVRDASALVISPVATRGVRETRIVVVSFKVTVLVESVWVFATALISMMGHGALAVLRVVQARHRQIISDNSV
jgi:hypothetical protein